MTEEERRRLERIFNRKYAKEIRRIEEKCFVLKKKSELKRMKKEAKKGLGLTTTKLLCYYIFIIFNIVLFYALVAMWHFADLSYLGVIISDILGQVLVYAIYSIRAYKDTKSEEDNKLEREKIASLPSNIQEKINVLMSKVGELSNTNSFDEHLHKDESCQCLDYSDDELDDEE